MNIVNQVVILQVVGSFVVVLLRIASCSKFGSFLQVISKFIEQKFPSKFPNETEIT
jgi:hypothetical protein